MSTRISDVPPAHAGGPSGSQRPDVAIMQVGEPRATLHYQSTPRGRIYRLTVAPLRLAALIQQTDKGYVATCAQLETLGYGAGPEDALEELKDATREYLSILAESDTPLSPRIAHHALYVPLLRVVDTDWITTVVGAPGSGQDAS